MSLIMNVLFVKYFMIQFVAMKYYFYRLCLLIVRLRISFYQKQLNNDMCMSMRLIDWNRGKTRIWHREDYEELMSSDIIFARE